MALLALIAAAPTPPLATLAGRYSDGYPDPFTHRRLDSVAEIVPVDAMHGYVRFDLQFPNGFSCGLSGMARVEGAALVYREPRPDPASGRQCRLTIRHDQYGLSYDDGDASCKHLCGMNAEFNGSLPWRSRRPIGYLARLRRSAEYRAALADLRAERVR